MPLSEDRGATYRETTKLSTTSQKQCMYPTIHCAKLNDWQRVHRCTCNYQIIENCMCQSISMERLLTTAAVLSCLSPAESDNDSVSSVRKST